MITAQQAKQLSEEYKKPASYVFDAIESMAKVGRRFATFEKSRLDNVSKVTTIAIDAGFDIEESPAYLTIKW